MAAGEFTSRARRRPQKERFRAFQAQLCAGGKCQGGKESLMFRVFFVCTWLTVESTSCKLSIEEAVLDSDDAVISSTSRTGLAFGKNMGLGTSDHSFYSLVVKSSKSTFKFDET